MKYIRTKDGRIFECFDDGIIADFDTPRPTYVADDYILKQADNIEELCDEFVSTYDKYHDHWDNLKECLQLCWDGGAKIYGAIWTDKGLIYVAKMNEEGELKLL